MINGPLLSNDFFNSDVVKFELQLNNYIDNIKHENNFKGLTNLIDLSVTMTRLNGYP